MKQLYNYHSKQIDTYITKEEIQAYLPKNPIIIEAGAHIGRDTKKMAKRWPEGMIHAFEPIAHLYQELLKNTHDATNIITYNKALSNKSGTATIYISGDRSNAASSLLKPQDYLTERPQVSFKQDTIETITLDEWAQINSINRVDFLWLDMQGNEYFALQGAFNTLKTVTAIYTEINITQRYKGHPLFEEYAQWLESHNFTLIKYELVRKTWGNALFVKKDKVL